MFTGLIEALGEVVSFTPQPTGARLRIRSPYIVSDAKEGDSICVNGVCLTALEVDAEAFSADLAPETLARTALAALQAHDLVNLERSLLPTTRLGGHILQGHVDGVGQVAEIRQLGEGNWWLTIRIPDELQRYVVLKGSIAIDGISLTVAAVEDSLVSVTIIPHTWTHTNLSRRVSGDRINLETDVIAKYVEKMLGTR
ncbi:riboflavin synthase [Bryobacter aggregatus]|uniref:riboflavin synthase n=1 Tax=Bryobacter aggregatus TaxID=360054 RepID=UPI0004E276A9|nr:riboflavin synthase [Bryobacter aggregatus]